LSRENPPFFALFSSHLYFFGEKDEFSEKSVSAFVKPAQNEKKQGKNAVSY